MEIWMVSGVFVLLLAAFSICGAVLELFGAASSRPGWLERWATRAAVVGAALAILTFVLYALAT